MAQDLNRSIKVYIDNSDAMVKAQDLESKISKLRYELEKLNAQGKKDSREYIATEKSLNKLEKSYGKLQFSIQEMDRILKNLSGATYKELQAVRRTLQRELKNETRGTEAYTAVLKQYHAVQKEITLAQKEMNNELGAQGTFLSRAANSFNKYFGMFTSGIAAITGISLTMRKLSQDAAAMEDVYADVMKTTGMTRDEVGDLNEDFKKMDTRTSREQLNMLARDAGKLGLSAKKDVLDFVEAGNQINVALGEDLGEGAIKSIGKMADVYSRSTKEIESQDLKGKMLAVGSAINELAQNSTASEPYLVAFAGRLGGVAAQAGIGIDKILGFASALDQDMQAVEMSATALQKFIMTLMAKPAEFAKYAKMEVGEFSELLRTDANEAIKAVLRTMNEKGGLQQLIPMFQEMGLDGARAVGVLSSMASSIDKIDTAQDLANKSMREGISTTNEYNVKNENAAAELEKRRKAFKDAAEELGRRLNPALLKSTNYVTYLVKLLPDLLDFLEKYGKYILYLGTVYVTYVAGLKLSVFWNDKLKKALSLANIELKLQAFLYNAGRVAGAAYNIVVGLLTGNLAQARKAWQLLNTTMATNPAGLVLSAIAALAGAFVLLRNNVKRARTEKQALNEISKEVAKSTSEERSELDRLLGIAKNERISKEERLKAIKKLNEISPEYLGNLSLENINTDAARKLVEQYTEALKENAKQKAISGRMAELYLELTEKEIKRAEHLKIIEDRRDARIGQTDIDRSHQNSIDNIDREIASINQSIEAYQKLGESLYEQTEAERIAAEKLESWRENTHKMGEVQLKKWIETNKDAADEYVKIAQEVYKNRFVSNTEFEDPNPTDTTPANNKKKMEAFEEAHKQKIAALKRQLLEENKTEEWFAEESIKLQKQYFIDKIALQKQSGESTIDTEIQQIDYLLNQRKTADESLLSQLSDTRDSMLQSLDAYIELENEKLQDQVDSGVITRKEYNAQLILLELDTAAQRIEIMQEYEEMVRDAAFETTKARKKALDDAMKATKKALDDTAKAQKNANRENLKEEEDFQKKRDQIREKYNLVTAKETFMKDMTEIDDALSQGLLKFEEAAKARISAYAKFCAEFAKVAVDVADSVAGAVTAYHKFEADSLEAQKQRELQAAGDNAEKREEIEKKYAQKELDLKKKQAGADAAIQIAQATSAAALAIANVWAKHAANPILAAALSALSAATTAIQIASIIKQKKAIMATTLDGSSTSSGSGTGARVVTQRAAGKYDVIGADDGRQYRNVPYVGPTQTGFVSSPTLMGEQGRELVVSAPDLSRLQRHINYPLIIRAIHDARSGVVPQRASGNYENIPSGTPEAATSYDPRIMTEIRDLLLFLKANPLKAYVLLSEMHAKQELLNKSQNIGKK